MQVEQRMHLDRAFVLAELRPRKQRKAQIDGGRIQARIDLDPVRRRLGRKRKAVARGGPGPGRSRRRCANYGSRWHRTEWSVLPDRENPYNLDYAHNQRSGR